MISNITKDEKLCRIPRNNEQIDKIAKIILKYCLHFSKKCANIVINHKYINNKLRWRDDACEFVLSSKADSNNKAYIE